MIYPGALYSLLMNNSEAAHFFNGLNPEQKQEILDTEFSSSQEFYDHITQHAVPYDAPGGMRE